MMRIDYRHYRQPAVIWTGARRWSSLALVAVLFGHARNGATRWFGFGRLGVQPSELAKIVIIVFIAALLERRMDRIDDRRTRCCRSASCSAVIVGLILAEPDLGTSVSIIVIAAVMIFAAGINYRYVVGLLLASLPALYFLLAFSDYRRRRMLAFLNPWADPLGDGFQMIQSHDRRRHRRHLRPRPDGRRAEAVLPAGAAQRLHLRGHRRGARPDRRDARAGVLLRDRLARAAHRDARARSLRRVPRARA